MGVDRNTGKLQARDWEEPPPRKANEELLDHQRKRKVWCPSLPVPALLLSAHRSIAWSAFWRWYRSSIGGVLLFAVSLVLMQHSFFFRVFVRLLFFVLVLLLLYRWVLVVLAALLCFRVSKLFDSPGRVF